MNLASESHDRVYTLLEVASALKISPETVRNKIGSNEIKAIEISSSSSKQYRILHSDLVNWLGEDVVEKIFAPLPKGEGLNTLADGFKDMTDEEVEKLADEASAWAKEQAPERKLTGNALSQKELSERFNDNPIIKKRKQQGQAT